MSRMMRDIQWAVTVADPEHWMPEHRAAADADSQTVSYDDWVVDQLADAMRAAGQEWINAHRDLIDGELI